jgi:hypothetical protein
MKLGKLYEVQRGFVYLLPTKQNAETFVELVYSLSMGVPRRICGDYTANCTSWWRQRISENLHTASAGDVLVLVDEDAQGFYRKFLTSDGGVGWTAFDESLGAEFFVEVG